MAILFAPNDVVTANAAWAANCGPAALGAVLRCDLSPLRRLFPRFPARCYTTLTDLKSALGTLCAERPGRHFSHRRLQRDDGVLPPTKHGLIQVQWTGPWTDGPKANGKWAYLHTHLIAVSEGKWVYDINALPEDATVPGVFGNEGGGWLCVDDWNQTIVPMMTQFPRATGGWFALNEIEVSL